MLYFLYMINMNIDPTFEDQKWADHWEWWRATQWRLEGHAFFFSFSMDLSTSFGLQLEPPNETWVTYVKRHKVPSSILVALSRWDAATLSVHCGISPYSLPSVPFINIELNSNRSFFIPCILELKVQISGLRTSHRLFFPELSILLLYSNSLSRIL